MECLIKERATNFNKYFSTIIEKDLWRKIYIIIKKKNNIYELNINNVTGNLGLRKSEKSAFDLAYMQFSDALCIKCLYFILYDQFEVIHEN